MTKRPKYTTAQQQTIDRLQEDADRYDRGKVEVSDIPKTNSILVGTEEQKVPVRENGTVDPYQTAVFIQPNTEKATRRGQRKRSEAAKKAARTRKQRQTKATRRQDKLSGTNTPEARKLGTRDDLEADKPSTGKQTAVTSKAKVSAVTPQVSKTTKR